MSCDVKDDRRGQCCLVNNGIFSARFRSGWVQVTGGFQELSSPRSATRFRDVGKAINKSVAHIYWPASFRSCTVLKVGAVDPSLDTSNGTVVAWKGESVVEQIP